MIAVTLTLLDFMDCCPTSPGTNARPGRTVGAWSAQNNVLLLMLNARSPSTGWRDDRLIAEAACQTSFSGGLYGVGMHDIPTLGFVALIMFCVVVASSWVPSWRASRLNPIEALRQE